MVSRSAGRAIPVRSAPGDDVRPLARPQARPGSLTRPTLPAAEEACMLRRTSLPALLLLLGASSLVAPRGAAQTPVAAATQPSDKPQGTTSSAEARAALDAAIQSADNIYFERAVLELDKALAADSGLGLA